MPIASDNGTVRGVRAGEAYVRLVSDTRQYDKSMDRARQRLRDFGKEGARSVAAQSFEMWRNRLSNFADGLRSMGTRMVIQASTVLGMLAAAVRQFMREGDRLDKMAARTGVDPSWLSAMDYAAQRAGATLEELEQALRQLAKASASAQGANALRSLGLSAGAIRRASPERAIEAVLERLALVPGASDRARLAMELFGKSGTSLVPLAGHVGELVGEARSLGLVWSRKEIADASMVADAWTTLTFVFRRAVTLIGGSLVPVIRDFTQWLYRNASTVADFLKRNQGLVRMVAGLATTWLAMGIACKGAALALYGLVGLTNVVTGGAKSLMSAMSGVGAIFKLVARLVAISFKGFNIFMLCLREVSDVIGTFLDKAAWMYRVLARWSAVGLLGSIRMLTNAAAAATSALTRMAYSGAAAFTRLTRAMGLVLSSRLTGYFLVTASALLLLVGALYLAKRMLKGFGEAWQDALRIANEVKSSIASGWDRVGEQVKSSLAVGLRGLAVGEYRRAFGVIANSARLAFMGVFRDFAAGWHGLVAEVKESRWVLVYALYEGWTWLVAQLKHMGNWFVSDMKKIGVAIADVFATAISAAWASWKNFFAGVAGNARRFVATMGAVFSEMTANIEYGFRKAYYWSKRILPGYGADDYERDAAAAAAERDAAVLEARAKALAAAQDASQDYAAGPSFLETWREGMERLRKEMADIDAEEAAAAAEIADDRNDALIDMATRLWRRIEAARASEMTGIRSLDDAIDALKSGLAEDTAALAEFLKGLDDRAETGYMPGIADDVHSIAAAVGATATHSAQEAAARWGGLSAYSTTLREAWIRAGVQFGSSARDVMRRAAQDIDNAMRKATLPYTAMMSNSEDVERLLARLVNESVRQNQSFNRYANNVSQMLSFA